MPSTQEEQAAAAAAAVEVHVQSVDHHTNNVIPDDDDEDLEDEYDDEDDDSEDDDDDEEDEDNVLNHKSIPTSINTTVVVASVSASASTPIAIPIQQQQQHLPTTIIQPSLPIATPISTPTPIPTPAPIPTLALTPTPTPTPPPKPSAFDDSRKLFQRLWTDEDEIGLLQGFLDYTSQRGGFKNSAYHHDTAPFYDQIKSRLQLDFNKSQLVEKLRRLKKKFRNVMSRINSGKDFSFKTPHDQATFEISRKIWSSGLDGGEAAALNMDDDDHLNPHQIQLHATANAITPDINGINSEKKGSGSSLGSRSRKRPRIGSGSVGGASAVLPPPPPTDENMGDPFNLLNCPVNSSLPNVIEETIKSCISPLFKELMFSAVNGPGNLRGFGGMASNILPLNFGSNLSVNTLNGDGDSSKEMIDDKWRKQQILELEVYSKRVELVQDQIKLALEELRSMDSG